MKGKVSRNSKFQRSTGNKRGASKSGRMSKRTVQGVATGRHKAENSYSVAGKIRSICNSKGVILNSRLIEKAGLSSDADILIHASGGVITITQAPDSSSINTNLSTWDTQFKRAIKAGRRPEGDVWGNIANEFDEQEWR